MNAVNLLPHNARRRSRSSGISLQTLGLMGGIAATLVAVVIYVLAANTVSARKTELARLSTSAAAWQVVANAYAPFVAESQQRSATFGAIRQLASGRFSWSRLLGEIGVLMPKDASLTSLQSATATGSTSVQTVQLVGCADSHATVAQTMDQLRKVTGVTAVTLASSGSGGSSGSTASGSASSGSSSDCPVQFQMSLSLGAGTAVASSSASAAS